MKTATVYRCLRCGCRVQLYVTPSFPPLCAHGGTSVGGTKAGRRPAVMVVEEPVDA